MSTKTVPAEFAEILKQVEDYDAKLKAILVNFDARLKAKEDIEEVMDAYKQQQSVIIIMDSNKELGEAIVAHLNGRIKQVGTKIYRFGNNELNTFPTESVRDKAVYIVGSGSNVNGSINDNFMAMCSMVRACRDASAKYITLLCAYYPYSRSDKKDVPHAAIMGKMAADFFKVAGAHRVITMDLHAAQIQGFFSGPFDNLYAINYLIEAIKKDYDTKNMVLISPDVGGQKRIECWAQKLGVEYTIMTKSRDHGAISTITKQELVHKDIDLKDKIILVVDDIFDTGGTMCNGSKILKEKGAVKVIAVVTHGVLSGKAFENLAKDDLDAIYVTNTLPQADNLAKSNKIKVVDVSKLFSDAIMACVNAESMSKLF